MKNFSENMSPKDKTSILIEFFVNKGDAKSSDLEKLIQKVKKKVFDKTGIDLELELQIIGEKL